MALVQKKFTNNKRTMILIVILLVLGLATLVVTGTGGLSWPFSKDTTGDNLSTGNVILEGSDLPVYNDLGAKVLDDARLDNLELHGAFPLIPGHPGRSNPFVQVAPEQ